MREFSKDTKMILLLIICLLMFSVSLTSPFWSPWMLRHYPGFGRIRPWIIMSSWVCVMLLANLSRKLQQKDK